MFFLFTWYIPYFAQNDASVSYNFYQVSPLLRLIIYYFWEVFKILPNILYSNPCSVPSLSFPCIWPEQQIFDQYLTNIWQIFDQNNNNKKVRASIVAIVPTAYLHLHLHQFVSCERCIHFYASLHTKRTDIIRLPFGQGRPFFWHSSR